MSASSPQVVDDRLQEVFDRVGVTIEDSSLPDLYVLLECQYNSLQFRSAGQINNQQGRSPDSNWLPSTIDEWLRYGVAEYLRSEDIEVCHPQLPTDSSEEEISWDSMPDGYHQPGSCVDTTSECLMHALCGGPVHDGQLDQHHITASSLPEATSDGGISIYATWGLSIREPRPEYIALITEAISGLDASSPLSISIGGDNALTSEIVNTHVINPLYTAEEVEQATKHPQSISGEMTAKNEFWRETVRDRLTFVLSERLKMERKAAKTGGESDGE